MPIRRSHFYDLQLVLLALLLAAALAHATRQNTDQTKTASQNSGHHTPTAPAIPGAEYTGMYNFLRDGEFVQITVDAPGHVIGFVSRYGDSDSDRDVFLDQLFKSGKLDGNQLIFATETVHGKSYQFHGTIERGEGKNHGDEAFYVLKGTLTVDATDDVKKASSQSHEVALKSFPQNMAPPPAGK